MNDSRQGAEANTVHHVTMPDMKALLYSLVASLVLMSATPAHAVPRVAGLLNGLPQVSTPQVGGRAGQDLNSAPQVSPAQAAQKARRRYGGKVLSVDLQPSGNYRVKIIDNGNVRVVHIPAN